MLALEVGLGLERGFAGVLVGDIQLAAGGELVVFLTEPASSPGLLGVMTAASLVPVMVTVMVCVAVPPLPSSTVTVMVSVTFWPSVSA